MTAIAIPAIFSSMHFTLRLAIRVAVTLMVLLPGIGISLARSATATTLTVNSADYSNDGVCSPGSYPQPPQSDCTLWEAIAQANSLVGADTISVPYNLTFSIPSGMAGSASGIDQVFPTITDPLTIAMNGSTLDANPTGSQVLLLFQVATNASLTLQSGTLRDFQMALINHGSSTLQSMKLTHNGQLGWFGQTVTSDGSLVLSGSTLDGNINAVSATGPIAIVQSRIANSRGFSVNVVGDVPFTLRGSSVANNEKGVNWMTPTASCTNTGSILDAFISGNGSTGLWLECSATIEGSTISGNRAVDEQGGGVRVCENNGGQSAKVLIRRSRILDNSSINGVSQIVAGGGGIHVDQGCSLELRQSTVSGNRTDNQGGGIEIEGFSTTAWNSPTIVIDQSAIIGNTAKNGGGIAALGAIPGAAPISVTRSTLYNNKATNRGGAIDGAGYLGQSVQLANVSLRNVTVWANTALSGSVLGSTSPIRVTAQNTMVAQNLPLGSSACNVATGSSLHNAGTNVFESLLGCPVTVSPGLVGGFAQMTTIYTTPSTPYGMTVVIGSAAGQQYLKPSATTPGVNAGKNIAGETMDQVFAIGPAAGQRDIGAIEYQ